MQLASKKSDVERLEQEIELTILMQSIETQMKEKVEDNRNDIEIQIKQKKVDMQELHKSVMTKQQSLNEKKESLK